jgi:NAD(P)-dependent dehydrogenase (short-subunit alcohol dehydrogenase family)
MIHTRWLMTQGAVIVTGGSKRIGREICLSLSSIGFKILIHHRNSAAEAEETAQLIRSNGGTAATFQADLSDASSASKLVNSAIQNFGKISGIVNNASVFIHDDISSLTPESWDNHMTVNAKVPILLIREMFNSLEDADRGSVVNILDQKLFNPNPDYLSYTASKYVMLGLTDSLSRGLAPKIRINAVAPGHTLVSNSQSKEGFERAQSHSPLGFGPSPEDIAEAVCYLMKARAVTGQVIYVDSGERFLSRSRDVVFETE